MDRSSSEAANRRKLLSAAISAAVLTAVWYLTSRIFDGPLTLRWAVVLFVVATLGYLAVPRLSRWFNGDRN